MVGPGSRAIVASALALSCTYGGDQKSELHSALVGRRFLSESVQGWSLVPNSRLYVRFEAQELGASAGCNDLDANYAIQGSELVVHGVGMTEMGCPPEFDGQDEWMVDLFTSRPTLELAEPRLTMTTPSTQVTLLDYELAEPDRPLVGTVWTGEGYGDGSFVTGGPGWSSASIQFDAGGVVTIQTGCHEVSVGYTVVGSTITLDALAYDSAPCADPALQWISDRVELVLDGSPVSFEIDARQLELDNGSDSLLFRAPE